MAEGLFELFKKTKGIHSEDTLKDWFNTLSTKELKIWIKMMDSPVNKFLNSDNQNKNILIAKEILKERTI